MFGECESLSLGVSLGRICGKGTLVDLRQDEGTTFEFLFGSCLALAFGCFGGNQRRNAVKGTLCGPLFHSVLKSQLFQR